MTDTLIIIALFAFWYFVLRWLWRRGWQPLLIVLIVIGWQRLVFYAKWIVYSRSYDKVHNFIDLANRHKREPVAGLVEDRSDDPTKL
ncbi:glucan phosphoethanolaminetransferase (alkaline phosphatase superfamily) [Nitrobacteraceae bacterium AZCC 2161]